MVFDEIVQQPKPVVTDGAWGTELAKLGLSSGVPETWNLTNPGEVAAIAASYVQAGSQIILTNTFGGTRIKLAKGGVEQHDEVNIAGVELSKRGANGQALVFASVGPTGELLGLTSQLTEEELQDVFLAQAQAILQAEPDGFVIETMTDLGEATCALRAVKSACDLPTVVSLSYDEGARGPATMMGVTPDAAAAALTDAGADIIGANCGRLTDEGWCQVVEILARSTDKPIWAKANAGIPQLIGGKSVFPLAPDGFGELGKRLAAAGAKFVGGCCGTTPEHIRALTSSL